MRVLAFLVIVYGALAASMLYDRYVSRERKK